MPSVYSTSSLSPLPSSTVITPSRPTLSMASASSRPISGSLAEIVAMCSMSSWPCSGVDCFLISSTTAWVAASMPRFMSIGLAPAARLRRPSVTIAWAMTVEVVVPSPATSLVLVAACLSIWAPIFWKWFSSSISLATVTPSWVTVGAPHFLSMATLRPRGPSVTLTALARASMPLFSCRRASASKIRSLAGIQFLLLRPVRDNGEQVALANDEVVLAVELDLCPGVLREQDRVATLDFHIDALSVVEHSAGADRQDGALLRLLACRIRQHDAAAGHLLLGLGLDDHAIAKRLQTRRHRSSPLPLAISLFCAKDRLPAGALDPHKTLCKRTIRTGRLPRTGLLQFSPAHQLFYVVASCGLLPRTTRPGPRVRTAFWSVAILPLRDTRSFRSWSPVHLARTPASFAQRPASFGAYTG